MFCEVRAYYDFGDGLVRVRCTKKGSHQEHAVVIHIPDDRPTATTKQELSHHKNVFKESNASPEAG